MPAPAENAPKSKWAAYAADEYGLDVDGMTRAEIIAACADAADDAAADLDTLVDDIDDYEEEEGVPAALQFAAEIDDDTDRTADAGPLRIEIDGWPATLNPPSETALAIRYAEYAGAETVMDQALAMLGLISTSMDKSSYLVLRQKMLSPRTEGKRFNDKLIADILELILDRWGGGREVPKRAQPKTNLRPIGGNRATRRARR